MLYLFSPHSLYRLCGYKPTQNKHIQSLLCQHQAFHSILLYLSPYQEELAKKVGYKSRSSVNKIEIDGRGLPQNKIVIFAKALETTPAYLVRWKEPSDEDIGNAFANDNLFEVIDNISALSPQEKNHFTNYLQLLEINRKKADDYVEQLLSLQQMDAQKNKSI